jgi:hypothetical protein
MKKQKRGIVPESHWTEHLIAVGIAIVVVLLVVMFTSCTTVQREKIIDLIDGMKPVPTATPEPDHEAPVDDNLRVIKGVDGKNAQVTKQLRAFQIVNTNLMTYKADSLSDWPMQVHNGKQVYGEAQLFVLRDGKWTGGKFDHVHPNGDWRDFKNVVGEHKGYLSITPVSGEAVRYRIVSYDGKQKTNMRESVWP